MTSNLGAREMSDLLNGAIGFAAAQRSTSLDEGHSDINEKIQRTAVQAASRNFSPEFMNRIDSVVVFHSLGERHLRQILELELHALQNRIMRAGSAKFLFHCSDGVKEKLLREGLDQRYGARHLKRSIEKLLVVPLANLVATGQVIFGDSVYIDLNDSGSDMEFSKHLGGALFGDSDREGPKEFTAFLGAAVQSQQAGASV
jgi:ATP-dependent Clp protease ATP-binding subunit ClpB